MAQRHLPALLIIMDGCGLAPADGENAVAAAKTPFLDSCLLYTSDAADEL